MVASTSSLKCHGTLAGSPITRPHVGQEPSRFIDVGVQNLEQSSHQGISPPSACAARRRRPCWTGGGRRATPPECPPRAAVGGRRPSPRPSRRGGGQGP